MISVSEKKQLHFTGVDKLFYKNMLKDLFLDTCTVKFWDGEEVVYGSGASQFKLIFNEPIPKADVIADPALALGEAYMYKTVEVEGDIQKIMESLFRNFDNFISINNLGTSFIKTLSNNVRKSKKNVEHHYDIGNDFYKLWLDDTMTYSCGYFASDDDTLAQAQKNKVAHILKKLNLKAGQTLLDIGCGWGELIIAAAQNYRVKATGITLSAEQFTAIEKRIKKERLENLVEVQLVDYRELKNRTFDSIVSVGMIEHVGKDHLPEYFSVINRLLNARGLSLLHGITGKRKNKGGTNSWINKYIFPGGYIPNINELINYMIGESFYLLDAESLRRHYGRTLENWAGNFEQALPEIQKSKDEVFIRMWRLYLNTCAAAFNCGNLDVHQLLFSKNLSNDVPWCRNYMYQ